MQAVRFWETPMVRRVLIINGHPDPSPSRFCAALCDAYAAGARAAGREVRRLDVATLDLPPIRSAEDFIGGPLTPDVQRAQAGVTWADHIVVVHPLWLGSAPALFKTFCEQVFRYGFALPAPTPDSKMPAGLLKGRSARIIVTMGMPALVYRLGFGAFGVRSFERSVLWLAGMRPIRRTLIGQVEGAAEIRQRALHKVRRLGEQGL
jgi:putative NADPH-quinone reductase